MLKSLKMIKLEIKDTNFTLGVYTYFEEGTLSLYEDYIFIVWGDIL